MRHAKQWLIFWAKCGAAMWLVHMATGLGWLQSVACVTLFLWAGLEAVRVLERLLRALATKPGHGGGDEGPEVESPIVIRFKDEEEIYPIAPSAPGYREWWRN